MNLILIKIIISTLIVVLLAEISTRVNPVLGGIFSGLPLGAGLSVYFISYQEGIPFLVRGIPWGISALSSSILFCFFYLITGRYFKLKNKNCLLSPKFAPTTKDKKCCKPNFCSKPQHSV